MSSQFNYTLLSTAYLPPIDYFRAIKSSSHWRLERHESYTKQSYRNRSFIYSANGPLALHIPIVREPKSASKLIPLQEIDYSYNWQINHWRALVSAYNSTPFFLYYKDELHHFYTTHYPTLFEFNTKLLELLLSLLGFSTTIIMSDSYLKEGNFLDFRNSIHPKRGSPLDIEQREYHQHFKHKMGFKKNLSIVDLLFNEGSSAPLYL
ncbi:MAG: WbqC family protein [Bacteroidales bacterium]